MRDDDDTPTTASKDPTAREAPGELGGGSELTDPARGGAGANEGDTHSEQRRGGDAGDSAVPQAGGALGGPADPIAGDAS